MQGRKLFLAMPAWSTIGSTNGGRQWLPLPKQKVWLGVVVSKQQKFVIRWRQCSLFFPSSTIFTFGGVFRLYPSGLFGCCGAAVALTRTKLLSARHLFEKGSEKYEDPVVVYIASRFLSATIDGRNHGLDVVSLTLGKPCDDIQPLPKAAPHFIRGLQPVVLVHFPLFKIIRPSIRTVL